MATVVKTRIVKIGNSHGIRIPKLVLDQLHLTAEVVLEVQEDYLIVRSSTPPRADWAAQFQRMATQGDDALLDPTFTATEWEATEWDW